jgi:hypothetical protein
MKASWKSQIVAAGVVCLVGGVGFAAPQDYLHRSSLRATVRMTDGSRRTVTLRGVGCASGLCSRVRAMNTEGDSVWLDSLASIRDISNDTRGRVTAILQSRSGQERRAAIVATNRVLYLGGRDGRTEKLDLASVIRLDFE